MSAMLGGLTATGIGFRGFGFKLAKGYGHGVEGLEGESMVSGLGFRICCLRFALLGAGHQPDHGIVWNSSM